MKLHLLALFLFLGATQNSPIAEGMIEGRVLRAGSGDPMPNTPVTLISSSGLSDAALAAMLEQISQLVTIGLQGGGGGGSQDLTIRQVTNVLQNAGPGVGTQASMLTDRAGHFAFANLPRGRYTVWVQRFNYFGPLLNGTLASTASVTLALDPPKPAPPVDLYMTQGLAISGRVLNEHGQPANGLLVTAYRSIYFDGKPRWAEILSRQIDDRGEYRLSPLAPGEYYVGVTPPLAGLASGQNSSIRTFFPGVTEPSQATKLVLNGSDSTSIDFSLRTAPATFFRITGVALNPVAVPSADGTIDRGFNSFILRPLEANLIDSFSPNGFPNSAQAPNRAAGEFEIRNVRPGIYEMYPAFSYAGFLSGRTVVDVRTTDAPGIRIVVNPVVTLEGRVVLTAANPRTPVKLESIKVALRPLNAPRAPSGSPSPLPVSASGQFSVVGPSGTLATLQVGGLPETAFISDIRIGANGVYDNGFELSSPSDAIQVVIDAATGGTVETTVRTAEGNPALRATVVLVPPADRRQNPMRYKTGITDDGGRLILRGVPPGSYTAFAWESVPDTAWQNMEFLSKYQDQGTTVTVGPGAQVALQLNRIPFDVDLK